MRSFGCYLHQYIDGVFKRNSNTACWAGTKYLCGKENDEIYISAFREPETEQHIELLVDLINQITPCSLTTVNNDEYIKFKLLPTFDQSLILLNFVRNLWHSPNVMYTSTPTSYSKEFFEALLASESEDPLARLTLANKIACKKTAMKSVGHSNCHIGDTLREKTKEELLAYKGTSTQLFLTR